MSKPMDKKQRLVLPGTNKAALGTPQSAIIAKALPNENPFQILFTSAKHSLRILSISFLFLPTEPKF